jgi:hypothetical protein
LSVPSTFVVAKSGCDGAGEAGAGYAGAGVCASNGAAMLPAIITATIVSPVRCMLPSR